MLTHEEIDRLYRIAKAREMRLWELSEGADGVVVNREAALAERRVWSGILGKLEGMRSETSGD